MGLELKSTNQKPEIWNTYFTIFKIHMYSSNGKQEEKRKVSLSANEYESDKAKKYLKIHKDPAGSLTSSTCQGGICNRWYNLYSDRGHFDREKKR